MNIEKISASAYKLHSHCPHAYFIQYNLKYGFPAGKAADRGTIVHRVLEILAEQKVARQKQDKFFSTAEIGQTESESNFDIISLARRVYDYQTTEKMPHHDWEESDFNECMKYINTALKHDGGKYNPLNRNIISTEEYIKIAPEDDWAVLPNGNRLFITGFIDLVTEEGPDVIEISDYKTGRQTDFHTGKELNEKTLRDDIQLKMYHYAATKIYGEDKSYLVTIFFLKTGVPITIYFTPDDLQDTKNKLKEAMNRILLDNFPRRNISWKCGKFCDFGKNTFEGTDIVPLTQILEGGIAKQNETMTICDQVNFEINRHGLDWVVENMCSK